MAKDLTNSRLDRQNILNNEIAIDEIQQKSGIEGILWEGKLFVTREMTANFFDVDIRTISRYLEQNSEELSANGYQVLRGKKLKAFLEAAKRYARGGYDVIVDGIVGPWFLEPWRALVREDYEVHYIVLRASKEETMKRAVERSKLDRKTNVELVETMWEQFCNLGIYESNVIETTTYSIQEAVFAVKEKISSGAALLS